MSVNKNITRSKREEVRRLKEQREGLKRKRQKFTHYGATDPGEESDKKSTTSHCIPLQYILQYTMDFATGRDPSNSNPTETVPAGASASTAPFVPPGQDFNMASPQSDCTSVPAATSASSSTPGALQPGGMATAAAVASGVASSLMQVDSPCHSPKMTPASSSSNLTAPPLEEVSEGALKDEDTPMDVEDGDEMNTSNGHGGLSKNGCDPTANGTPANACSNTSATESEKAKSSCTSAAERPKPRSVSEEERRVIMVRTKHPNSGMSRVTSHFKFYPMHLKIFLFNAIAVYKSSLICYFRTACPGGKRRSWKTYQRLKLALPRSMEQSQQCTQILVLNNMNIVFTQ